jgi:hypothetical protein
MISITTFALFASLIVAFLLCLVVGLAAFASIMMECYGTRNDADEDDAGDRNDAGVDSIKARRFLVARRPPMTFGPFPASYYADDADADADADSIKARRFLVARRPPMTFGPFPASYYVDAADADGIKARRFVVARRPPMTFGPFPASYYAEEADADSIKARRIVLARRPPMKFGPFPRPSVSCWHWSFRGGLPPLASNDDAEINVIVDIDTKKDSLEDDISLTYSVDSKSSYDLLPEKEEEKEELLIGLDFAFVNADEHDDGDDDVSFPCSVSDESLEGNDQSCIGLEFAVADTQADDHDNDDKQPDDKEGLDADVDSNNGCFDNKQQQDNDFSTILPQAAPLRRQSPRLLAAKQQQMQTCVVPDLALGSTFINGRRRSLRLLMKCC